MTNRPWLKRRQQLHDLARSIPSSVNAPDGGDVQKHDSDGLAVSRVISFAILTTTAGRALELQVYGIVYLLSMTGVGRTSVMGLTVICGFGLMDRKGELCC